MCEFRWKWEDIQPEKYTKEQKRLLLSKVVEIAVKTTFKTHYYKWSDGIYKQMAGGPIGLRASGSIAKLCMEIWLTEFRKKLEQLGIKVWLLRKYVDDVLIVCSTMRRGDRVQEDGGRG